MAVRVPLRAASRRALAHRCARRSRPSGARTTVAGTPGRPQVQRTSRHRESKRLKGPAALCPRRLSRKTLADARPPAGNNIESGTKGGVAAALRPGAHHAPSALARPVPLSYPGMRVLGRNERGKLRADFGLLLTASDGNCWPSWSDSASKRSSSASIAAAPLSSGPPVPPTRLAALAGRWRKQSRRKLAATAACPPTAHLPAPATPSCACGDRAHAVSVGNRVRA